MQGTITVQREKLDTLQRDQVDLFENPDGKITWVNQKQQLVWINLGRKRRTACGRRISRSMTTTRTASPTPRPRAGWKWCGSSAIIWPKPDPGRSALQSDPARRRDSHARRGRPASGFTSRIAGHIDIDKDGVSDFDLVKNIILMNGGVVDAELREDGTRSGKMTIGTRYLVLGTGPDDKSSAKVLEETKEMRQEALTTGTSTIEVQKFLEMMGWKAEERTVELAGSGGTGEFRKRGVGKKAKAAPTTTPAAGTPAGEPAEAPAPMPAGADPFAADPFGAPMPKATPKPPTPMPPGEEPADPFGAPTP